MKQVNETKLAGTIIRHFDVDKYGEYQKCTGTLLTEVKLDSGKVVKAYHTVTAWGALADVLFALKPGAFVKAKGSLSYYTKPGAPYPRASVDLSFIEVVSEEVEETAPEDDIEPDDGGQDDDVPF